EVKYNRLNLPTRIACSDKSVITFEYDELGAKLAETDSIPALAIIRPRMAVLDTLPGLRPNPGGIIDPGIVITKPYAVTRTEYCGSCVYVGGKLKRLLFPGGYATPKAMGGGYDYHYFVTDYLGSVRAVVAEDGTVEESSSYYPYGMQMPDEKGSIQQTQPYKYGGKERLTAAGVNLYDFGPRALYSPTAQFTSLDPKCEDYPNISPYVYCMGDPINYADPTGCDTVNICYKDGKWNISNLIIAKGDDVFNITIDDETSSVTFSEGEYGNRVDALTLQNAGEGSYALGVYHVSGEAEGATGFYVTPGGESSNVEGSKRRIKDGVYPIKEPDQNPNLKWHTPGVGGVVASRGIRFHYTEDTIALNYTKGCFVLATDYSISNGKIIYDLQNSLNASISFNMALGANEIKPFKNNGRTGAVFNTPITHKLILKTR
ncbi:MAG: hypothetical protein K2N16_03080, partial [Muribaculaceae bacterium]|nr:hypothetical protein [Muribaculaceae bacterium]